jgi:DNA repair exonuclease SbcCD ATPase subunit
LKGYEDEWDKYKDAKDKEDKLDREISQLINKLSTTETEEIRLDTQITQQQQLIKEYYKNEKQIQKNKEIRDEISGVREKLTIVKDELKGYNTDILKLNGKVSALQNQKETIEDRINEVKDMESQSRLFDFYLNALSKDGVSYELIEKALPMIEGEVNNILAQIVEFGMQLEIDGKNINAYLVYGDQRWSLEMCSGMERFISGLAIRVALINVCNLPRPNFLVIDEGFGTLDSENLQSLFMLFTYLKTQFDFVMIISHIDSMRDVVDGLIEIKKEKGFSNVKF